MTGNDLGAAARGIEWVGFAVILLVALGLWKIGELVAWACDHISVVVK